MRHTALLVFLLGSAAAIYAADPILGTWQLNVAKSHYDPGPPPKSVTRIYSQDKDGVKAVSITVYKNGNTDTVHYPSDYDGKEHPVAGSPDTDGIVMKRVDDYTAESNLIHAGKVIGTTTRTVSRDGKTLTITFKGTGELGEQVSNRTVYDKVAE
jgi:hypothetical protein